jgi:hypothetical protein
MARRFTTGFELRNVVEHNGPLLTNITHRVVTSPVRTGQYALRLYTAGLTVLSGLAMVHNIPDSSEVYTRACIYLYHPLNVASVPLNFVAFYNGSNCIAALGVSSADNRLVVTRGGTEQIGQKDATQVATGYVGLRDDVWYVVECYLKVGDAGNGRIVTKVNGVTDIDFTGQTNQVASVVTSVRFGGNGQMLVGESNKGRDIALDDLAINDATGTQQNGWVGMGGVYLLLPNADGFHTEWTPSSGSQHYVLVDEIPADASDYVYATGAAKDTYAHSDLPELVNQIRMIEVVGQFALSDTGSRSVRALVRHNGTTYNINPTQNITSTTPTLHLVKSDPIYEVLGGSGNWTRAQINNLEAGWEAL